MPAKRTTHSSCAAGALFLGGCLLLLPGGGIAAPTTGKRAPDFSLRDREGALFRVSDCAYAGPERPHRRKHPLLLDFFRTDCKPCRAALPKLARIHKRYKKRGLRVVLIALLEEDEGREKLEAFLKKTRIPFTVLIDAYGVAGSKYVRDGSRYTIPATFVVDRSGVLRRRFGSLDDKQLKRLTALLEKVVPKR
jgi:peroxiredoxin